MVAKNYIILAYGSPGQLNRLINHLDDGCSCFYVHVDQKGNINDFKTLPANTNIVFVENRENCSWGDFSLVQATINCMEKIIADKRHYYTILLSESCYPIVNNDTINAYIESNIEFEHIDIAPVENIWETWRDRIIKYKINLSKNRSDYILWPYFFENDWKARFQSLKEIVLLAYKRKNLNLLTGFVKTFRKRHLNTEHFGGSAWWGMSFTTLDRVTEFIKANPQYIRFYKDSLLPDEIFFHTIIHQLSLHNDLKIKPSLTYVNWTRKGTALPVTFNEFDLDELLAQPDSNKLFARKFILGYSDGILKLLDERSKQNEATTTTFQ